MAQITTHPHRNSSDHKTAVAQVKRQIVNDLERLEQLKPELNSRYEAYKARVANTPAHFQEVIPTDLQNRPEIALQLARQRYRNPTGTKSSNLHGDVDLATLFQNLHSRDRSSAEPATHIATTDEISTYSYPSVSPIHQSPPVPQKYSIGLVSPQPPQLPPKTSLAPALPAKLQLDGHSVDTTFTFQPIAKTESGRSLRPLFLPQELHSAFLSAAQPNTSRNLETCGILAATLISGALFISHLIIPAQTSTSDTCDTTPAGDAALFDYVDSASLLVCGWIHTHPTQTCFLSSRDLHTTLGYQVMLEESISIVCAPAHRPDYGIFRLTDPPGIGVIRDCAQPGIFHPHHVKGLYTDALRPGHVSELKGLAFELVDLRL